MAKTRQHPLIYRGLCGALLLLSTTSHASPSRVTTATFPDQPFTAQSQWQQVIDVDHAAAVQLGGWSVSDGRIEVILRDGPTARVLWSGRNHATALASPLLATERLIIELRGPVDQLEQTQLLRVDQKGPAERSRKAYSHKAGGCELDAVCRQSDATVEGIQSTVLLQVPFPEGLGYCSGSLVANSRRDGMPYLLTAEHCGITPDNASRVVAFWRFETEQCSGTRDRNGAVPDPAFSHSGTTFLARAAESDFNLLLIGTPDAPFVPPDAFAPYWSGFDAHERSPLYGYSVHHPNGDEKSISLFHTPPELASPAVSGRTTQAWQVFWDEGVTEPGSSGSGLWNDQNKIIGVLSGGVSSCAEPDAPDFYGRLSVSWDFSVRCDQQLAFWLDPSDGDQRDVAGHGRLNTPPSPLRACTGQSVARAPAGASGSVGLWLLLSLACSVAIGRRLRAGRSGAKAGIGRDPR